MKDSSRTMIIGVGSETSGKVLTNFDLEKIVDTTDEWIRERSGIERRHILEEDKTNSDIAAAAGKKALDAAGISAKDLDFIILGTVTGDSPFPSTACRVQDKLHATHAAAFDLSAACSGFVYSLALADSFIKNGNGKYALVIGSEVLSRFTDWEDRSTCVLFGDGAGAVVVGPADDERGILSTYMKSNGKLADLLHNPGGGSSMPTTHETVDARMHYIKMAGREVYKHAVRAMADAASHGLKLAGCEPGEIDLLIPHQANTRIIDAIASRLKLPEEKVFINIQEFGNTSAASIPIALDQALREGRIQKGSKVLMVAFGGGFTWGSALVQF